MFNSECTSDSIQPGVSPDTVLPPMPDEMPSTPAAAPVEEAAPAPIGVDVPLPVLHVSMTGPEIVSKLDQAARRGRMPGFHPGTSGGGDATTLFTVDAFGTPFDGRLHAHLPNPGRLEFSTIMRKKTAWVFAILMVAAIYPGVELMASMAASTFPQWPWLWKTTYWWYMPLTAPFVPWLVWSSIKRSKAAIHDSAHHQIRKIAGELGIPVPPTPSDRAPVAKSVPRA